MPYTERLFGLRRLCNGAVMLPVQEKLMQALEICGLYSSGLEWSSYRTWYKKTAKRMLHVTAILLSKEKR